MALQKTAGRIESIDTMNTTLPPVVKRASIVLSNLCPYAYCHKRCPAHNVTEAEILPTAIIRDVLDGLASLGFDNKNHELGWHGYNEPLCDPRLVDLMKHALSVLPNTGQLLWTNGWYLTEQVAAELVAAGATRFFLSAYTDSDLKRFRAIHAQLHRSQHNGRRVRVQYKRIQNLDDRTDDIELYPETSGYKICSMPLEVIQIWPDGTLGLCCYDYEREVGFGKLDGTNFCELLQEAIPKLTAIHDQLARRERGIVEICRRCPHRRYRPPILAESYWKRAGKKMPKQLRQSKHCHLDCNQEHE